MLNKEQIEKLLDCSNCNLKECISCEITYTDRKNIREYIKYLESEVGLKNFYKASFDETIETATRTAEKKNALELENKKLKSEKQKLIEKLEEDIVNITKILQDGKHNDYYSKNRLKAYRTKTKEILEILKGENNENRN